MVYANWYSTGILKMIGAVSGTSPAPLHSGPRGIVSLRPIALLRFAPNPDFNNMATINGSNKISNINNRTLSKQFCIQNVLFNWKSTKLMNMNNWWPNIPAICSAVMHYFVCFPCIYVMMLILIVRFMAHTHNKNIISTVNTTLFYYECNIIANIIMAC